MFKNVLLVASLLVAGSYAAPLKRQAAQRPAIQTLDGQIVPEPCADFMLFSAQGSFPDGQSLLQCVVKDNLVPVTDRLQKLADDQVILPFPGTRRRQVLFDRLGPKATILSTDGSALDITVCANFMADARLGDSAAATKLLQCMAQENLSPFNDDEKSTILSTGKLE
ncbi:hypothetical protein DL96DRAFT_1634736 [Flagelloscypha sp. PMI_526]|nr:hypothetical protein DL96DRAFT_1634736 [Flagelloscypha sp. PMI_526]